MANDIIKTNQEMEQFVIQASFSRSRWYFGKMFGDKYKPLEFVHVSDMHNVPLLWKRMVKYVNHYSDYISFVIHTGDYCGGSQKEYTDLYKVKKCMRPIYNCVGNHDCVTGYEGWELAKKKNVHELLFNHTEGWDVHFSDCKCSMSYYKDFPDSNVRMIVLDIYYDIDQTRSWLKNILDDACEKGVHVLTAMHQRTGYIVENINISYSSLDPYKQVQEYFEAKRKKPDFDRRNRLIFEDIIVDFIQKGGKYVCNLAGHEHHDEFGFTEQGVLNIVVANGTTYDEHSDMRRIKNTRALDCFNVMSVDTDLGVLKVIRIGANTDHLMRKKTAFCFDYVNKKLIADGRN